jgi:hypothetical protein
MNLEELIQRHNQTLDRKIEEDVFLNQRIIARLHERQRLRHSAWWLPLKKSILVYSFLLILFTILNFILVNNLDKRDIPSQPAQQTVLALNAFSPHYPGSISRAYQEVLK